MVQRIDLAGMAWYSGAEQGVRRKWHWLHLTLSRHVEGVCSEIQIFNILKNRYEILKNPKQHEGAKIPGNQGPIFDKTSRQMPESRGARHGKNLVS
jgi:hypothetical protein